MSTAKYSLPCLIAELPQYIDQRVVTAGWIHTVRRLGGVQFLVLRDGSGLIQVVQRDQALRLHPETVVSVVARVVRETRAPGGIELHEADITVLAEADSPLPIDLSASYAKAALPTRLTAAPILLRHPEAVKWLRMTDQLVAGFRHTLHGLGFVEIHTPKILGTATESGSNVFEVEYFGRKAYLAQSPQLYKQMMAGVLGRVFEVGPVFRAEPHDTARHLSQYTSLDVEVAFISDHRTVMGLVREVIAGMVDWAREKTPNTQDFWPEILPAIPIIHFAEALDLVSNGLGENFRAEPDLAPAHEAWLGQWAKNQYGSDFLFVEGYPTAKRPFYTHPDPSRPQYTRSFDLLFRGQELVTGGQRLHQYRNYVEALQKRGMSTEGLEGYLMAFQYGMPPHGGFALGLERLVARLMGFSNIREATIFPRDLKRLTP